jgi:hypothetical protein
MIFLQGFVLRQVFSSSSILTKKETRQNWLSTAALTDGQVESGLLVNAVI